MAMTFECKWHSACPQPAAVESPANFCAFHHKAALGFLQTLMTPSSEGRRLLEAHYRHEDDE